jgi:DNA-binding transcriptional MerR regulator
LRIGELARLTGVSPRVLRYYEKKKLITPTRLINGYREYNSIAIKQVKMIQFYLSLGFTTDQISNFLNCVLENNEAVCQEVLSTYEMKIKELDDYIKILSEIKSNLEERVHAIKLEKKTAKHKGNESYDGS